MSDLYFVDTNIFVYRRDRNAGEKQRAADAWIRFLWRSERGRISTQVLSEYYVTVTQKLIPGLPREQARAEVVELSSWGPLALSVAVVIRALEIQDRFQLSYWDSLIAAAAQVSGCRVLLSEDLQDGLDIEGTVVQNPFLYAPPA